MGMVFKNIEYMNGGCFENLSGTSVPKIIGRGPPGEESILTWILAGPHSVASYDTLRTYSDPDRQVFQIYLTASLFGVGSSLFNHVV
jgi:hypothetical protein